MRASTSHTKYVVISPVKDEERYVESTLRSVTSQTVTPVLWVIVDDGSKDGTAEIVRRYAAIHPFIRLVGNPHAGSRQPGSGVIHAFNYGRTFLGDVEYDFIVKLDCDLSFEPDYFEKLLARFMSDERLGIASGTYAELNATSEWKAIAMPSYHAFGASKVVRRSCFEDIAGFPAAKGWDTVDEIRAWSKGWTTRHFTDLETKHHKREGSGIGLVRTARMQGHIYYVTGGDPLFFGFKVLHRLAVSPLLVGAAAQVWGYCSAYMKRSPRLVTESEARCYRKLLRQRLLTSAKKPFVLRPASSTR